MKVTRYGTISKVTDQPDGSVLVEGIASSESVDSQGEVVKAAAMAAALPAYMKFGNVREMHQAIAAGKAVACAVDDAGVTHLTAHVVDAGSVAKVKAGVLQGFSIGGTVKSREKGNPKIIDALELTEISLVDRPANPDAMIELVKFDKPAEPIPVGVSTATVAAPVVDKPAAIVKRVLTDELRKSLFSVGWLAEVLSTLDCIASDQEWEAAYEGDGSGIPARLRAAVASLAEILRDMAAEETAELTGEGDVLAMAAKPGSLRKTEKLAALLKTFSAAARGVDAGGPNNSSPSSLAAADLSALETVLGKLSAATEAAKAARATPDADALTKRVTDAETSAAWAMAKVAAVETERNAAEEATKLAGAALQKVMGERDALIAQLARANAELATKGVLRVVAAEKGADGRTEKSETPPPENTPERALYEIRKVQSSGGRPLNNR